ncbi:MAG: radical SAM protein [Deltaproteobacteria bacterium]|nr:radical SAM protein [Deltaproteobacteria bacterium]
MEGTKRVEAVVEGLSDEDRALFAEAWDIARARHGREFTFYLPGMIRYGRERGRYPALSITGNRCDLLCEHCRGMLLEPMIKVAGPADLEEKAARLKRSGAFGVLLSGGSDREGRLPWYDYLGAIGRIHTTSDLFLTAHAGFPDLDVCRRLKEAGVRQALIDVMGDERTARDIYHLEGLHRVQDAMEGIAASGLAFIPHIVAGLYYGDIRAEGEALERIRSYLPSALVIVVLTPLKGTSMEGVTPPGALEVARLIARARLMMPGVPISLGCERPRNREGVLMERLALMAGATRMAVWSEEAVRLARNLGLEPRFQATCCSLDFMEAFRCEGPRTEPGPASAVRRTRSAAYP